MKRLKEILRITIPLALGILIFWWVYRAMDFSKICSILENGVAYQWLALSVFLEIISHIIRAARWQMLIKLLDAKPSIKTLTNAVFINYGANLVFPRLGEVWRCVYVSRKEQISFTRVFGTMISERLVDIFVVGLMILVALFTMMDVFEDFVLKNIQLTNPFNFKINVGLFYLFSAVGLVICTVIYRKIKKTKLFLKVRTLLHDLWIGIKTLVVLPHKAQFTGWSFALWITYFFQFYVCFFAFDFTRHLDFGVALATFVMGTIAFSIPVQGGIGPWHFMVISTLIFYGVGQTEAAAFALVVHTLQTVVNAIVGFYAFLVTGTSKIDRDTIKNQ
ncbi:MAG: lysylphosphatidylglycerol synthase transmembrane domain-containing protein [Bacteroidales bacterium]